MLPALPGICSHEWNSANGFGTSLDWLSWSADNVDQDTRKFWSRWFWELYPPASRVSDFYSYCWLGCFSATWPDDVRRLANSYMKVPIQVFIGSLDLTACHTVTQLVEMVQEEEKPNLVSLPLHTLTHHALWLCALLDGKNAVTPKISN